MNEEQLKAIEGRREKAIKRIELPPPRNLDGIGLLLSYDIPALTKALRESQAENAKLKTKINMLEEIEQIQQENADIDQCDICGGLTTTICERCGHK